MTAAHASGKVYLVGAGPGDPKLLTLRGVECLRQADLVLFDYLVNPAIVEHVPATAERVCLLRNKGCRTAFAESVIRRMVDEAKQGKTVVRLKGGDPVVFGHLAEELAALNAASIAWEVVPGVTSGLAAAAHAGIAVTQGRCASAVALVAGHERGNKTGARLDYAALAKFPGTLIFYMGVATVTHWSGALLREGKSPETPVTIVQRCAWPDQTVVHCTLGSVVEVISTRGISPPAIVLVGDAVATADPSCLADKEQQR